MAATLRLAELKAKQQAAAAAKIAAAAREQEELLQLRAAVAAAADELRIPPISGDVDEATYDRVAWALSFSVASSSKDRMARIMDGTAREVTFALSGLSPRELDVASRSLLSSPLTFLDLSWCRFDVPAAKVLSAVMKENTCLTALRLWNNPEFGDEGVAHFSGALKVNCSLTALDLSSTGVTVSGVGFLGSGVAKSKSLATLSLSRNRLADEGVSVFLAKAATTSTLRSLNLSRCGLTDAAAASISAFLLKNSSLQALNLANNKLRFPGVDLLGEGLAHNAVLTSIDLSGT